MFSNPLSCLCKGSAGEDNDRHYNRRARGQLRTKIESGEGTIPVSSADGIQETKLVNERSSDVICEIFVYHVLIKAYYNRFYVESRNCGKFWYNVRGI